MTEIVPPEDKYNPVPRRVVLAIATACALFAAGSESSPMTVRLFAPGCGSLSAHLRPTASRLIGGNPAVC